MAELYVVSSNSGKEFEAAVSGLEGKGYDVQTLCSEDRTFPPEDHEGTPALMLVDLHGDEAKALMQAAEKRAGDYPVVLPAREGPAGPVDGGLPAEALYIPSGCDVEETLGLIRRVLAVWHGGK